MKNSKPIEDVSTSLTPPIKWAGGKRWLVPELKEIYQRHGGRLVEPFCGACSIALGLRPSVALLNDINAGLINFWREVQKGTNLKMSKIGGNTVENFRIVRHLYNQWKGPFLVGDDPQDARAKAAGWFYFLNRTCFNGLYRENASGDFNVPFGKYKSITLQDTFPAIVKTSLLWDFTVGPFNAVRLRKDDFVYADPPYDRGFSNFSASGFTWEDQVRLAKWLQSHRGVVVASNLSTPRILQLYRSLGFKTKSIQAPRRISSNGDREPVKEVLLFRD